MLRLLFALYTAALYLMPKNEEKVINRLCFLNFSRFFLFPHKNNEISVKAAECKTRKLDKLH